MTGALFGPSPLTEPPARDLEIRSRQSEADLLAHFPRFILLVAIHRDKPLTKTSLGQAVFQAGDKFGAVNISDAQNNRLLALFTDHDEKLQFSTQSNSTHVMPAKDPIEFALNNGYSGLVANPATLASRRIDAPQPRSLLAKS